MVRDHPGADVSTQPQSRVRWAMVGGAAGGIGLVLALQRGLDEPFAGVPVLVQLPLAALLGMLVGWMLPRLEEPRAGATEDAGPGREREAVEGGPEREGGTAQMVFYAFPAAQSSSQLRTMRVSSHTAPMAPPALDLRLVIEEFDHTVRLPVVEGALDELPVAAVQDRVERVMNARLPPSQAPPRLELVGFRSEGPLLPGGTSPFGWTFYFVDGRQGLACVATATRFEVTLWFHTAPTWHEPASREPIDPAALLEHVRARVPRWEGVELRIRANPPDDVYLYRVDPLCIADIDPVRGTVRNREWLDTHCESDAARGPAATIEEVLAWFRGEDVGDSSGIHALETAGQSDLLRTLQPSALRVAAAALQRTYGADTCAQIHAAVLRAEDVEQRRELLHLLAHVPSGLAAPSLQRVALTHEDSATRGIADDLFRRRRRGELGVAPDPIDELAFEQIRHAMGRDGLEIVALRSTYDLDADVVLPLQTLGFRVTRRRLLAGEARLPLAVTLRAPSDDSVEAVITSTPLPVPCHVLHIIGPNSGAWRQKVERADLAYGRSAMLADLASGAPYRVHVAALYVAALRARVDGVSSALIAAHRRGRADANLRKAIVLALEFCGEIEARDFLASRLREADGIEREAVFEVLSRLGATEVLAQVSHPPSVETKPRFSGPFHRV